MGQLGACYAPPHEGGLRRADLYRTRQNALSPYASQERFVELLKEANGPESVEFLTLEGRRWQHMNTTVRMHKSRVEESPIMKPLFAWLGELG